MQVGATERNTTGGKKAQYNWQKTKEGAMQLGSSSLVHLNDKAMSRKIDIYTFPTATVDVAISKTKSSPLFGAATDIGLVPNTG